MYYAPKTNTADPKFSWVRVWSPCSNVSSGRSQWGTNSSSGESGITLAKSTTCCTHSHSWLSTGIRSPLLQSCTVGPNTNVSPPSCLPRVVTLGALCEHVNISKVIPILATHNNAIFHWYSFCTDSANHLKLHHQRYCSHCTNSAHSFHSFIHSYGLPLILR